MEKIKVSQAIVVEGKYDKIKLSAVIDGMIICTNGFGIYKDKNTVELIRLYARTSGIIVLTDSDSAGFQIRNHLKGIVPQGKIINLYIPEVFGKERRKTAPSKEGKLGVEGIDVKTLREIFERSGVLDVQDNNKEHITSNDFYELGLSGKPYSSSLRKELCRMLGLPVDLTSKALTDYVDRTLDKQKLSQIVDEISHKLTCK
jgi:ribonuclease M5